MEKCTYCVQRINAAQIDAERRQSSVVRTVRSSPPVRRSVPTQAIVFGNINDPNSSVAKLKAEPRNYALLAELNTRPRTTYLAAVRNPRIRRDPNGLKHAGMHTKHLRRLHSRDRSRRLYVRLDDRPGSARSS